MRSNVLTAGQIPTHCEQAYYNVGRGVRSIDGVCRKTPVTHTLIARPIRSEVGILTQKYICRECSLRPWTGIITPLSEYELEVSS